MIKNPQDDDPAIQQLILDYWQEKAADGSHLLDGSLAGLLAVVDNGRRFAKLIDVLRSNIAKHPTWLAKQLGVGRRVAPKKLATLNPEKLDQLARAYEADYERIAQRRLIKKWLLEQQHISKKDAELLLNTLSEEETVTLYASAQAHRNRREVLDDNRATAFECLDKEDPQWVRTEEYVRAFQEFVLKLSEEQIIGLHANVPRECLRPLERPDRVEAGVVAQEQYETVEFVRFVLDEAKSKLKKTKGHKKAGIALDTLLCKPDGVADLTSAEAIAEATQLNIEQAEVVKNTVFKVLLQNLEQLYNQ